MRMDELLKRVSGLLAEHGLPPEKRKLARDDIYYLSRKGLIAGANARGLEATYPAETADRVAFISLLRHAGLQTPVIRQVMQYMTDDDVIRRVARGEEPLQVMDLMGLPTSKSEPPPRASRGRRERRTAPLGRKPEASESLAEMVASKRSEFGSSPPPSEEWQRIPIGDRVEIGIRGRLRRKQMEQIAILGELLRTIVEER
jgi:hypothetical protein